MSGLLKYLLNTNYQKRIYKEFQEFFHGQDEDIKTKAIKLGLAEDL
jgi:hypothetical protein